MKTLLGFDISSSTIGWATFDVDDGAYNLSGYGNIRPPGSKKGSLCFRVSETYDIIYDFIREKSPDFICVEAYANKFPSGKSTARTIIVLSVFNEVVSMACLRGSGIEPVRYPVSTIRSSLSKFSNVKISSKDEAFDFIVNNFPEFKTRENRSGNIAKECFDEADAIAVAFTYILKEFA